MKIPSPGELGLPAHFDAWRPSQVDALERLLRSSKRVKALSAPTGFGKTAVYVAYALLTGKPTAFVTDSRGLQDQLLREFGGVGMVDIRGRRNYPCDLRDEFTCEDGYAARCPSKGSITCPASRAEMRAATSPLVVTNYDKWTASRKYGMGMDHFQSVVFDEAHKAPDALSRAASIPLGEHEIGDLGLRFPPARTRDEVVNWKGWASRVRAAAEEAYEDAKEAVEAGAGTPAQIKAVTHLRHLVRRLSILSACQPEYWIVEEVDKGYQFDPIRPGRYAESMLLLQVPDILTVSATLRPKTLFMLGIAAAHFDFQEFPSDFDKARCPIYYIPTQRVDVKHPDLSQVWIKLDQIAAKRTDRKGLVHPISYDRARECQQASRFGAQMFMGRRGEAASEIVEDFWEAGPGAILNSPAIGEGYDFPGRAAEWQFICKIPFPDSRSRIVQARQEDDKEYGAYQAMNKLVQTCGRLMRSREDQGETFIVDMNLDWFLPAYRHLAPRWFKSFYQQVAVVPQPPPRL